MKKIFIFILIFPSSLSISAQVDKPKQSQLNYGIKVLCMAEVISNGTIPDSAEIYCLLNDKLSELNLHPLESSEIFNKKNYKFYRVGWNMKYYDSCKDGADSVVANVFTSLNPYGGKVFFKVAIKTEKVAQKNKAPSKLYSIYKIQGFDTCEINNILLDIYEKRASNLEKVKKLVKQEEPYIETVDILEMLN